MKQRFFLTPEQKKRCEDKVIETYLLAEKVFNQTFELCALRYGLTGERFAGTANLLTNLVNLNPFFFVKNEEEQVNVTVPHEIAHLITYKLYPHFKQAHGPEWKSVMVRLGQKPEAYHNMECKPFARRPKPYVYTCPCNKKFRLSLIKHRRMLNRAIYRCPTCKGTIQFLYQEAQIVPAK